MATLILAAAVVALVAVVVWQNRHRLPTRRHQRPQAERTVECAVCAKTLPVSQAVVVADTFNDDDEGEMMGGTVCMVEYCPEHAPPGLAYGSGIIAGLRSRIADIGMPMSADGVDREGPTSEGDS